MVDTVLSDDQTLAVVLSDSTPSVVTTERVETVYTVVAERGPKGRDGVAGGKYTHTQSTPATTWVINHNLGVRPNVSLLSVGGAEIVGDVLHPSVNQSLAIFVIPVAGSASCS